MSNNRTESTSYEMNTPKTYPNRPGTTDSGKEYELKVAALLLLRCMSQLDTEHAWLAMNVDECGAFDDIVLYKQKDDGKKAIYLIQLKHEDKGSNIETKEFRSKKSNAAFSLEKYYNSIMKLKESTASQEGSKLGKEENTEMIDYLRRNRNDIVFVLFTNRGLSADCEFLKGVPRKSDKDINFMLYETINTSANGMVFEFNLGKFNTKYEDKHCFLEKFFLFSNQHHLSIANIAVVTALKSFIRPVKIPSKLLSDICLQFLHFLTEWSKGSLGGYYPITRTHIFKKLTELLLAPYMVTLEKPGNSRILRQALWNQITDDKDVIVINEADEVVVDYVKETVHGIIEEYCENSEIRTLWKSSVDVIRQDLLVMANKTEKISYSDAYHHLWKTRKVPLLLEVSDPQAAKQVQDILKLSKGTYRFIIFNKSENPIEEMDTLKVLSNISDLNKNHQNVILQYPATLQERKSSSVHLVDLIDDTNIKYVTVKDIIYILLGMFNIGNAPEALPEFFQEMSLTRVWLETSVLQEVQNEMFVIKCDTFTNAKIFLQLTLLKLSSKTVSTWANIKDNSGARIIIFDNERSLHEIETFCLAKSKAIHFLVFHNLGSFEWTKSIGTVQNITPFRTTSSLFKPCLAKHLISTLANRKSILISSKPGTGKSVLLNYIAHKAPPDLWVLKINLVEHKDVYKNWDDQNSPELFHSLVGKILTRQKFNTDLVKALFHKYLDNRNVVLLLDGFDDIPLSCQSGAEKMITFLNNMGYLMCLTTRPVLKIELESILDTFSMALNLFTRSNQDNFLCNYFSKAAGVLATDERIESFVELLLDASKKNLNDVDNRVTGIPLHTTLLAGVFTNDCIKYLDTRIFQTKHFDLLYLYKHFIDEKINIACSKIKGMDEDTIIHYKVCRSLYAIRSVFSGSDLKALGIDRKIKLAKEVCPLMIQLIQKDGIVVAETESSVSFVHKTFAEYLTAEWLSENINGKYKEVLRPLVKETFHPRFEVVRNIFDRILAKGCPLHLAIINRQVEEVKTIVNSDVNVFNETDKGNRIFLHLIASWGLYHPQVDKIEKAVDILKASDTFQKTAMLRRMVTEDDMTKILESIPDRELLKHHRDDILDYTPLDFAIISNSFNVANAICAKLKKPYNVASFKLVSATTQIAMMMMDYASLVNAIHRSLQIDDFGLNIIKSDVPVRDQDTLHHAAKTGNMEDVRLLISEGKCVNEADDKGRTPLHAAVIFGHTEIVRLLLSYHADPNKEDHKGDTPLHWAAILNGRENGDSIIPGNTSQAVDISAEIINLILPSGGNIDAKNKQGNTPLMTAAYWNHTDTANLLLHSGSNKEAQNNEGQTALHIAVDNNNAGIVNLLLSRGSNTECKSKSGDTALISAAFCGNMEILNLLLDHGANLEEQNHKGWNALMGAAVSGHAEVVSVLLSHGANKEVRTNSRQTALHLAVSTGQAGVVNVLLSQGSDKEAKDNMGCTALVDAVHYGNVDVLNLLLSQGSDVEARDDYGFTALATAATMGYTDTVDLLLSHGANIEATYNEHGNTALTLAAAQGHEDTVNLLLSHGSNTEAKTLQGDTALIVAAQSGHSEIVNLLLLGGSDKEAKDNEDNTALILAAVQGHAVIVHSLLSHGADCEAKNIHGNTAFTLAASNGHHHVVNLFLSHGVDKEEKTANGNTALILAVWDGHMDVANLLLTNGCDKESRNNDGGTALMLAASNGHADVVDLLLTMGSDKEAKSDKADTALLLATCNGHYDCVSLLVSHGSEKEAKNCYGHTALLVAANNGHLNIVELLLEQGSNKEVKNEVNDNPLILAAVNGHADVVNVLLCQGSNTEATNIDGNTALIVAASKGYANIVNLLLEHRSNKAAKNRYGDTPLTLAAFNGHTEVVNLLLDQGFDNEATTSDRSTALMLAAGKGYIKIVDLLLSKDVNTEARTSDGDTALILAACNGHVAVAKLLLAHGSFKEAKKNDGCTALMLASAHGHVDVVNLLLSQNSNKDATNDTGSTALTLAALNGQTEVVHLLLGQGFNKEAATSSGNTALTLAADEGYIKIVDLLLSQNANTEARTSDGDTALILAACNGHIDVVNILLSHGSHKEAKNNDGCTALMLASAYGHVNVVNLLLSQNSSKDATNNTGNTALTLAALNGQTEAVHLLLGQGFNKEAATSSGNTALTLAADEGYIKIVDLLLSQNANTEARNENGHTALILAAGNGHSDVVNSLLCHGSDKEAKNPNGETALTIAATLGHLGVVELLLTGGSNKEAKNNYGDTALTLAACMGHVNLVNLLLRQGSDKEAKTNNGLTALSLAAFDDHVNVVELLLLHGSDKEAKNDDGHTALTLAACMGHVNVVNLLLRQGSDKEAKDNSGNTALILSAGGGHTEVVTLLLSQGSNIEAKNKFGNNALMLAACNGHAVVVGLLLGKGANKETKNEAGFTALMLALSNNHKEVAHLFSDTFYNMLKTFDKKLTLTNSSE